MCFNVKLKELLPFCIVVVIIPFFIKHLTHTVEDEVIGKQKKIFIMFQNTVEQVFSSVLVGYSLLS